ncbi:MAG: poly-beta,6-N-acetyl-D-glucosamine synthase [Bacteroidales bacterium]|jgi:cellulose synthase/poly-beta-1,6-N-acetylglucosamine synthase-like glycosyltransferase|nr:poly-beta,6-N-acetyl-D-glucosamine synthase [Bacteroidales bacterium]NLH51716.1 glycosyltransferase family 2 protein [Bacteroidales bacterium]
MLYTFWEDFFYYIEHEGFIRIINLFWYYFYIEAPRFLVFDLIILGVVLFTSRRKQKVYERARYELLAENPLVSVIVPGKNEGKHIYKLVKGLREQTYTNLEFIIVDDGSDDDTYIICRNLIENGMIDMYLRNEERGGKASAANLALRYARGKFVVHVDADTSFDRDAIERLLIPFYVEDNVGGVGGNVKVRNYNDSILTSLQAIEYLQTISVGRMVTSYLGIYKIISGAFGAFRKDVLDRLGGWDIGPGLDGDITMKMRKLGYKIRFEPKAVSLTNVPTNLKALSNQRLRWSKSLVRFRMRKHSDVFVPQANFNFSNFFAIFDNIFYNFILDMTWWFYLINLIINNIDFLMFIIPLKFLIYTTAGYIQFFVSMALSERRSQEWKLFIFVPLMTLYTGYYMRVIRTMAYFKEIFWRSSYYDAWNPEKTSRKAMEIGI